MKRELGVDLIMGGLLLWPHFGFGQQAGSQRRVRMTVVVCDQANVNSESLAAANQTVNHIMSAAGFEVVWIDAGDLLKVDVPRAGDPSRQNRLPTNGYLAVAITPNAVEGSNKTEAGFAAVATGPYRRAYVFYDRVEAFADAMGGTRNNKNLGIVLGHIIAHELGHLLLPPGQTHTSLGIMRGYWDYAQWRDAVAGKLLFSPRQAKLMRSDLATN